MTTNLAGLVRESAAARPSAVAIVHRTGRTTWAELDAAVDAVAASLRARGLAPGDRVALLMGNRPEFVVGYFGALRAGMVAVPLNAGLTAHELVARLTDAGVGLVLAGDGTLPTLREAAAEVPAPPSIVDVDGPDWVSLVTAGRADGRVEVDVDPEQVAVLLFTSGTTGRPRAAMLSHRALLANLEQLSQLDPTPMLADDVVLLVLPLFHVYALNSGLGMVARTGATAVLEQRFDPVASLATIRDEGVTNVPGAPPMYVAWSAQPQLREALAGVRLLISGAAPLPPAVLEQFLTLTGRPVWEGYGMTEAAPVVTSTIVSGTPKPGSVGRPIPGVEVSLRDAEGVEVEDDEPGEVWVRGANLFSGYFPDGAGGPDDEGWYATGDVAFADDDGDLHLVDRTRELILVSGFNVYPREVEQAIDALDGVQECAVIGVPHPYTGEAVKALVVVAPGSGLSSEAVLAHCETRLARFKCPTIVAIVDELPHTTTGKVSKGRLRELDEVLAAADVHQDDA